MAASLEHPFAESCCDGGAGGEYESARPCGCDPGANWVCQVHRNPTVMEEPVGEVKSVVYADPLERHLRTVVDRTWNFSGRLETPKDHMLNAVMGLAGEAGEVLDEHKKLYFHTPKYGVRTENIKQELGDVCYYLAKTLDLHGLTLAEVLEANKIKLFERHDIRD